MDQKKIIKAAWFAKGLNGRKGLPIILWGEPGTGKSKIIEGLARSWGLHFNCTIASICEPADLAGYPIPNKERTKVDMLPPRWIHDVNDAGSAVQLFDECGDNEPAKQSALMKIVLDGKAGDVAVNPDVRFIMAGNPPECSANPNEMSAPLANRFAHLDWHAGNEQDWISWVMRGLGDEGPKESPQTAQEIEAMVEERWPEAISKAKALVAGYIDTRGMSALHNMPDPSSPDASRGWPSRRSWEFAIRALASSYVHGLSEAETSAFISAYIGTAAGTEFCAYMRNIDLPNTERFLLGLEKWKPKKNRADRTLAVLYACAAYLVGLEPPKKSAKAAVKEYLAKVEAYWVFAADIQHNYGGADFVIPSARVMCPRDNSLGADLWLRYGHTNATTPKTVREANLGLGQIMNDLTKAKA